MTIKTLIKISSVAIASVFWGFLLNFYGSMAYSVFVLDLKVTNDFHAVILAMLVIVFLFTLIMAIIYGTNILFKFINEKLT